MKMRLFLAAILIGICVLVRTSAQNPSATGTALEIPSDRLATLQKALDERTDQGFRLARVSYHSSIRNLHSTGRLDLEFVTSVDRKYHYRVINTDMEAQVLERALNQVGANGFRLLRETPIPIELGLLRPRDRFIGILEEPPDSSAHYAYRVIAYRQRAYVQTTINQALADGFIQACSHQFGPVIYLVMERAAH